MTPLKIRSIELSDIEALIGLWVKCDLTRPHNDPQKDIQFAMATETATVLVGEVDGAMIASAMVGYDGHRGVVYYVACDPDQQKAGHGRAIMAATEDWLRQRGVWKLNLMVREENEAVCRFYETLGYEQEPRVIMSRRLD